MGIFISKILAPPHLFINPLIFQAPRICKFQMILLYLCTRMEAHTQSEMTHNSKALAFV